MQLHRIGLPIERRTPRRPVAAPGGGVPSLTTDAEPVDAIGESVDDAEPVGIDAPELRDHVRVTPRTNG